LIRNQICNNSQYGMRLSSGFDNRIWNNTFIGNNGAGSSYNPANIQSYDDGTNNLWNSSCYGNYWSDWTTPDNIEPWGIVDDPYVVAGTSGARDEYPLYVLP